MDKFLTEKEIDDFMSFRKLVDRLVVIPDNSPIDVYVKEYSIASCYVALMNVACIIDRNIKVKVIKHERLNSINKVIEMVKRDKISVVSACKKLSHKVRGYNSTSSLRTAVYKRAEELGISDFISKNRGRNKRIIKNATDDVRHG